MATNLKKEAKKVQTPKRFFLHKYNVLLFSALVGVHYGLPVTTLIGHMGQMGTTYHQDQENTSKFMHYGLPVTMLIAATGRFGLVWSNLHMNLVTWVPTITKTKKILQNFSSV